MAGSRRKQKQIPVESSWRMVEGENESFDTSLVPEYDYDQDGDSQYSATQPFSVGASQEDSIESFLEADEDRIILRTPFRPSVPQSVRQSARNANHSSPSPEFYKPDVAVKGASSRTKQRQSRPRNVVAPAVRPRPRPTLAGRFVEALPDALSDSVSWLMSLMALALGYAQKPLAIALSVYLALGAALVAQNMATRSISVAMSPICRFPGASLLHLPFCLDASHPANPVEFDAVVTIQDHFERVVETSAEAAHIPLEMKRAEMAARDLRTVVRHSTLQGKQELMLELDGFVNAMRTGSSDLLKFNSHVSSAVDSLISINRFTSRYLDDMAAEADANGGQLAAMASWALTPFRPDGQVLSDRRLLDMYMDHTAQVSDKLAKLIQEGTMVLRTLRGAEDHLGAVHEYVTRTQKATRTRRSDTLWTLWTLTGANSRHLRKLGDELALLGTVGAQRSDAVHRLTELVTELEKMQADLGGLRDSVKAPSLVGAGVPLAVHVEIINAAVERLEEGRRRIRATEDAKIRDVGANPEARMIDSF